MVQWPINPIISTYDMKIGWEYYDTHFRGFNSKFKTSCFDWATWLYICLTFVLSSIEFTEKFQIPKSGDQVTKNSFQNARWSEKCSTFRKYNWKFFHLKHQFSGEMYFCLFLLFGHLVIQNFYFTCTKREKSILKQIRTENGSKWKINEA